jgi:glycosyltransferase involved in cell wall biosynthesis
MKIGEFSDSFMPVVDGVGRVVYMVSDQLAKTGNEVSVIAPMTDMGYRGRYPFEIIDYCSQKLPRTAYQMGNPITDIHFNRLMEMKQFDIVHLHTPFIAGRIGLEYGKRHQIQMIGTFHSRYYDDFVQITNSRIAAGIGIEFMISSFFEACDEVWVPTRSSAKTLESYGYEGAITVMPNGMEPRELQPEQKEL